MKIYLASIAPGNEGKTSFLELPYRLFSWFHISRNLFTSKDIYIQILQFNRKRKVVDGNKEIDKDIE